MGWTKPHCLSFDRVRLTRYIGASKTAGGKGTRCCQKNFVTNYILKRYTLQVHEKNAVLQCADCSKKFVRESDLKRHRDSVHSTEKITCKFCDTSFTRKDNLLKHLNNKRCGRKLEKEAGKRKRVNLSVSSTKKKTQLFTSAENSTVDPENIFLPPKENESAFQKAYTTFNLPNSDSSLGIKEFLFLRKEETIFIFCNVLETYKAFKVSKWVHCIYSNVTDAGKMIKNVEFKTPNNEVLQETNLARLYDDMSEKIVKESEDFGGRDSGWTLDEILRLEVRTNRYSPFKGSSSFIEMPKQIAETKAIINVINKKDSQCFMWSILAALYPNTSNPNKTTLNLNIILVPETRDQPLDKLLRTVSVVEILRTVFEFENLIYTKCGYRSSLKKIRTPVRRAATELSNSIKIELEKENASSDLIEELLAKLIDKEKQLENVDKNITILTNMDDLEKEIEKQQEYRDSIITCKVRANKILNKRETESRNTPITSSRSEQQFSSLKLPQLQIPQFDGNILKFSDFFAQFEAAIHNNSNLSDVEKFNYLKSYLIDEAEIAIRGLTLSANNYTIALNIIKERFGRKDLIIDSHMSKLLHLNPVRKSDDILSLRKLYSECEIHIRGLQNCRVNPDTYSSLLYPIILKSIPRDLSLEFTGKSYGQTENMISDLLDFLKIEIQCRERTEHLTKEFNSYDSNPRKETRYYYNEKPNYKHSKFNKYSIDSAYGKNKNTYVPTTSTFVVNVNKCVFCLGTDNKNDHSSDSCPKSIEESKLSLRKNGICYLCLTRGHIFRACKKARVCANCKGRHSELICDTSFIPTNNPNNQNTSSENAGVRGSSPCNVTPP
ncbi:uncharacterized protein TNCV_3619941 [Trichonephila clavipes]|nr:uncharacterized protein TNCV_3619941 [Trichonephila clavipes]